MSHVRQQVREAAVADLGGLTTTGSRVFTARVAKLAESELPALKIMLWDEAAELDGQALGTVLRRGRLVVEGWAQGGDGLEDKLDTIAAEVEARIYGATPALDELLMNIYAPTTSIELLEPEEGVSRRTGVVKMLFPVEYRTAFADPTTIV